MTPPRSYRYPAFLIASASILVSWVAHAAAPAPEQIEFFEKNIRPLFAEHCTECHSAKHHENGLRLDDASAVTRGSEYGPVIIPGNPSASKLVKAINHIAGPEPMPKKADKLKPEQIALIERWITAGAAWPASVAPPAKEAWRDHWAFQKVVKPAVPKSAVGSQKSPNRNPIDAFVAAKLAAAHLSPAPPADAATLCRRIYLDLIGLQPTFEQVEAFKAESSRAPQSAILALTQNLLASPHYGERWGRYWLDIARYSDTEGYQVAAKDIRYPYAYTFRDWVIQAINEDLPYDQFLMQQLAADRLAQQPSTTNAPPSTKHLAALGFLTVGDTFIGSQDLQVDDRIDATCRGMLGFTVACARCHNHKYDPIPTKDYYALYSIFRSSEIPEELPIIGQPTSAIDRAAYAEASDKLHVKMAAVRSEIHSEIRTPEAIRDYLAFAQMAIMEKLDDNASKGRAGQQKLRNRIVDAWRDFIEDYAFRATPNAVMLAWSEFAKLPTKDFAAKASEIIQRLGAPNSPANGVIRNELAQHPSIKNMADVALLYAHVFLTCLSGTQADNADWQAVRHIISKAPCPLATSADDIEKYLTLKDNMRLIKLRNDHKKLELDMPGAPLRAMVMVDRAKPSDVAVMIRGNPARRGELAPRANLSILGGQLFKDGSGRLELARAIANRDNPLTARVAVNRVWMQHFGRPLVPNPSDFGVQTSRPEQAELLDYLAATFMDEGWSLKNLHRLILTSATYQQSCQSTPDKELKDAENTLLSRFNRQRLDYEAMRDAIAQTTGALNEASIGGRSVPLDRVDADSRRSVYHVVDRYDQATVPAMFDFANPDMHSPQRSLTTVPQQALFLMNSPFMKKQSEALSAHLPRPPTTLADAETIKALYRRVLLRQPSLAELDVAQRFLSEADVLGHVSTTKWTYGTAKLTQDTATKAVALGDFVQAKNLQKRGNSHQMWLADTLPCKEWGHLFWGSTNGHAGPGDNASIARWEVPYDRENIRITGTIQRPSDRGNGVRAWIINSRTGLKKEQFIGPKGSAEMTIEMDVQRGDQVIFAVTCEAGSTDSDSFNWAPSIYRLDPTKPQPELITKADRDFCGPDAWPLSRARPQSPLAQLTQVLLMSNEFMFVE